MIKRVRCDDAKGTKGGFFLYFGKEAAIQHLAAIESNVNNLVVNVRQRFHGTPTAADVDIAVLKMCEDQSEVEKWPCLTATTVSFLSFLFQHDSIDAVALPGMSNRLVEAKRNRDPEFVNESAQADVNRRVYDVVSVLVSCNLILISVTSDLSELRFDRSLDRFSPRKHVRFNYEIFEDPSCLKIADLSAKSLSSFLEIEKMKVTPGTKRSRKSRTLKKLERKASKRDVSSVTSRLVYEEPKQEAADDSLRIIIPKFSCYEDAEHPFELNASTFSSFVPQEHTTHPSVAHQSELPTRNPLSLAHQETSTHPIEDLFPPISSEAQGNQDWWDESLKEFVLLDALPSHDLLDWEMMLASKVKEDQDESWGLAPPARPTCQPTSVRSLLRELDLTCHEDLLSSDDEEECTTNGYFC